MLYYRRSDTILRQWQWQSRLAAAEQGLTELKRLNPLGLQTRGLELEYLPSAGQYMGKACNFDRAESRLLRLSAEYPAD